MIELQDAWKIIEANFWAHLWNIWVEKQQLGEEDKVRIQAEPFNQWKGKNRKETWKKPEAKQHIQSL